MPLELNAFDNNAIKQKVTQIADALLTVYDRSTRHNDQIMSNQSTLLDELAYLELDSEDTFEDATSFNLLPSQYQHLKTTQKMLIFASVTTVSMTDMSTTHD